MIRRNSSEFVSFVTKLDSDPERYSQMANVETAIGLQESLLAQAEELACELKVSRSRLFELALENFIREYQDRKLFEQINAACDGDEADEAEQERLRQSTRQYRRLVEGEW
jgi:metal-responsive CopG/Arc/MetJ family transcriptional regulator